MNGTTLEAAFQEAIQTKHGMKIAIIGSTQYRYKMQEHAEQLRSQGITVRMPVFDSDVRDEMVIITENRELIVWADEVHVFWDGRSQGTLWDVAVTWALNKPMRLIYLNPLCLRACVQKIAEKWRDA